MKPKSKKFILLSIGLFILIIISTVVRVYSDKGTGFMMKNQFIIRALVKDSSLIVIGSFVEKYLGDCDEPPITFCTFNTFEIEKYLKGSSPTNTVIVKTAGGLKEGTKKGELSSRVDTSPPQPVFNKKGEVVVLFLTPDDDFEDIFEITWVNLIQGFFRLRDNKVADVPFDKFIKYIQQYIK